MLTVANFMQRNPSAQFEEVREIAAAEGGRQAGFMSRQISWLSDIGALAPMLGLLGTVVGMMKTFFEIANGDCWGFPPFWRMCISAARCTSAWETWRPP